MLASRMMIVLAPPITAETAQATIARARSSASRPTLLRFALPASLGDMMDGRDSDLLYYMGNEALEASLSLLTDETHFLLLAGAYAFAPKWDASLLSALRSLNGKPTVLTGSVTPSSHASHIPALTADAPTIRAPKLNPGGLNTLRQSMPEIRRRLAGSQQQAETLLSDHPPEVCLPAIKESPDEETIAIGRGLPLVCSAEPVKTLLIDPVFLFGPVKFLHDNTLTLATLSLAAYITGWRCYVPGLPALWPVAELPLRSLARPSPEVLPGTTISRFEQLLGFRYDQRTASAKAALGLFGTENTYPQRMSPALLMKHKVYAARQHLLETHMPLLVSAFIDLPVHKHPVPFYTLRFGFLKNIRSLPLLLFTGGSQERQLRASFPHTQSYPDNTLLPRTLLSEGMTPQQHFDRSKPLLMLRAARRQVEFTHIAWLDMDILPHPVCPDAIPDFAPITDDRIHLATVGGVPDASFILIPRRLLSAVSREVQSITLLDAELKRGFGEELLWERLFNKKPEWFCIHPMPRKRLFFLSLFDPRLLSHAIRSLLDELPNPFLGTASDEKHAAARVPRSFEE